VGAAVARAERAQLRLTDGDWGQPSTKEEAEAVVRASILLRYGFPDRAKDVLQGADVSLQATSAVQANLVEVYVALEELEAAQNLIGVMRESQADGGSDLLEALSVRSAALRGDFDAAGEEAPVVEESETLVIEDDEEVVEMEMEVEDDSDGADDEPAEARGDRLAAEGDVDGAMAAYRSGLAEDPTNETLLMKIGELLNSGEEPEPMAELPMESLEAMEEADEESGSSLPDFQSIFDGGGSAPAPTPTATPTATPAAPTASSSPQEEDEVLSEARGRLLVGQYAQVAEILGDVDELSAHVLMAKALMRLDDVAGAMRQLRDAMDEADEDDSAGAESLWLLARLQAVSGKHKAATKTLDKLVRKDASHRPLEVAALRRGIAHLSSG